MTQLHSSTGPAPEAEPPLHRQRHSWQWLLWSALAGICVGVLWWILAPTGLNLLTRDPAFASGLEPESWLPRDLTLAGLLLFAGSLSGVLFTGRITEFSQRTFAYALAGGLLGALIAWQAGLAAAALWGGPVDATANASIAFSLRSLPVLLVWPAALAAATFLKSLLSFAAARDSAAAGPGLH